VPPMVVAISKPVGVTKLTVELVVKLDAEIVNV